jgi:Pyridine nucleotide-disulphide oxidoreductase
MPDTPPLDLVIIGGGIGGVISLHYARQAGLNALLLEKENVIGGLWAQLPAWQDVQLHPVDWTLGDLPIGGPEAASIAANIRAWVERFALAPFMRLGTPVTRARETADGWEVTTPGQTFRARHLIAATGGHNRPTVPPVETVPGSTVRAFHSSALVDPTSLAGQHVVVVGGGASAFDLLDLCFEHGAREVVWVYRSVKWMMPTRKPKHVAGDIRELARQQMLGVTVEQMNAGINLDLQGRYTKFGLQAIQPAQDFDFRRDQLIPGRRTMIEHFARIERHRGEVVRIAGGTASLSDGSTVPADLLLWGTGYTLDLGYFESPALSAIHSVDALAARCGSLFRALDAHNLFFLATVLEGSGSATWAYTHAARTIVSHIRGTAALDTTPVADKLNHFELVKFLAARDPASFPPATWHGAYKNLTLQHPAEEPMPIPPL